MRRTLSENELDILERLLNAAGRPDLFHWASNQVVEDVDDNLLFSHPDAGTVNQDSIAEAEFVGDDGIKTYFSLRMCGDYLHVLDMYRDDGSPVKVPISASAINVFWTKCS
jgi:hypothetical protein